MLYAWIIMGAISLASAQAADWPVYRHDARLSGASPGTGRIVTPEVKWEHYLGAPFIAMATDRPSAAPNVADLDGDGQLERFTIRDKTIEVTTLSGELLWSLTVDGRPLGQTVRVCKLLPERAGLQIVSFSSRMDTGEGQGYCFSFHNGAAEGELAWTTGPIEGQYAPTRIVDDVDGDGLLEVVTAPHYKVQIFDGQTGELKAEVPWPVGRNYGALVSRPRADSPQKDLFIVCDFVLHVDCIRYVDGEWVHAWGHKYVDPGSSLHRAREKYIRVGPNPVTDVDGDGKDEMLYMLVDAEVDDQWHLRVRDCETGEVRADIGGVWVWSVTDIDGNGMDEIIYTPTSEKRPPTYCDLHIGRLNRDVIDDVATIENVRPITMNATLPSTAATIADEGRLDLLTADLDGDGRRELFYALKSSDGRFEDTVLGASLTPGGELEPKFRFSIAGHRLNTIHAGPDGTGAPIVRIRDLTDGNVLTVNAAGTIIAEANLGRPSGFQTTPIVVDIDADGTSEIIVQTAAGEIVALRPAEERAGPPEILWSLPGVAMSRAPGYVWNGDLCPQAADLDGDGVPEVVFASEDDLGRAALVCVDGSGKQRWSHSFDGCPWGGLQAGVNLWTFGRFTGRDKGLDVYVDVHLRSKGSSGGWVLRGDTGEAVWHQGSLVAETTAMPFGGGMPAVADVNGDGIDDLVQEFYTIYAAISGATGEPLFPPAYLPDADHFGKWIAYSSPTIADLNGDGELDVYLNSASYARGGYSAVEIDGKPLWVEFHDNEQGSDGFGAVGDFNGDGSVEIAVPVLNGTLLCLNAADGSHKWRIDAGVTLDVIAADVNGDGVSELIFCERDGTLRAVSGADGSDVWSIKLPAPGRLVVGDVDADGFVEILLAGYDGVLRVVG